MCSNQLNATIFTCPELTFLLSHCGAWNFELVHQQWIFTLKKSFTSSTMQGYLPLRLRFHASFRKTSYQNGSSQSLDWSLLSEYQSSLIILNLIDHQHFNHNMGPS